MPAGENQRRPRDALGSQPHRPYGDPRTEGKAYQRDGLSETETVENVFHPEGVAITLRRRPRLRTPARLAHDVRRV